MHAAMVEVSVIIVCMNRPDILFPCLDSIRAQTGVSHEVLVVAYRFTAENMRALVERYPWVEVIPSLEPRGFSENNNLALKPVKGRFCFIVNDDTLLSMPVIDRLVEDFGRLPEDAAAISPKIVFADGHVQTCGRAPWTAWRYVRHYLHLVDETVPSAWSMKEGLFRTWTLNGACFLVRTDVFRSLGGFDERYFFTPEDIALGHLLNASGYTVWADSGVQITHLAGGSVSRMEAAIKPARVRGALIFYGDGKWFKTTCLSLFIWSVELVRLLKHFFRCPTAVNVMKTAFSKQSPKDIFIRFSQS